MDNSKEPQPPKSSGAELLPFETPQSANSDDIRSHVPPFWKHSYPPRLVLVSDLDHTMVQNEDHTHHRLLTFNAIWQIHNSLGQDLLVFSTGRSPNLYRQLWEEAPLLTPAVLICSVGTEIFYLVPEQTGTTGGRYKYEPDAEWEALLDQGWDRQRVLQVAERFPELRRQVDSEQRRHKLSFHLVTPEKVTAPPAATSVAAAVPEGVAGSAAAAAAAPPPPDTHPPPQRPPSEVLRQLQEDLQRERLRVKVVYSGGRDVDLLAEGAGKGAALLFLLSCLNRSGRKPRDGVLVCGDSGNDIELFQVPGVFGCVVSNAFPELREFAKRQQQEQEQQKQPGAHQCTTIFQASEPCAGGILQTLRHFKLLPPPSPPVYDMEHAPSLTSAMIAAHRQLLSYWTQGTTATMTVKVTSATVVQTTPSKSAAAAEATAAKAGKTAHDDADLNTSTFADGCNGGEESAHHGGGGGGDGDDEAKVALDDADNVVAAAAAAAAAAGMWMDEVHVDVAPLPAAAAAAVAAAMRQHGYAAVAGGVFEWTSRCKAYQLLPNGHRNTQRRAQLTMAHRHDNSGSSGSSGRNDGSGSSRSGGLPEPALSKAEVPPSQSLPPRSPSLASNWMGPNSVPERRVDGDGLFIIVEEEDLRVPGGLMAPAPLPNVS